MAKLHKLKNEVSLKQTERHYIQKLILQLETVRKILNYDKRKYVKIMKRAYDKYRSDETEWQLGEQLLFYVGDKEQPLRKLRERWTGPFSLIKKKRHNTYELLNKDDGSKFTSHVDHLKKYIKKHYWSEKEFDILVENGTISEDEQR